VICIENTEKGWRGALSDSPDGGLEGSRPSSHFTGPRAVCYEN